MEGLGATASGEPKKEEQKQVTPAEQYKSYV